LDFKIGIVKQKLQKIKIEVSKSVFKSKTNKHKIRALKNYETR
jgi:hypothetical protein